MTPTIGRIVHYKTVPSEQHPESRIIAAIITDIKEDGAVCLTKFAPGKFATPLKKPVMQGDEPGQWNWPPKV